MTYYVAMFDFFGIVVQGFAEFLWRIGEALSGVARTELEHRRVRIDWTFVFLVFTAVVFVLLTSLFGFSLLREQAWWPFGQ